MLSGWSTGAIRVYSTWAGYCEGGDNSTAEMKSTRIQLLLQCSHVLLVCVYVAVTFPSCPMLKPTFSFLLRRSDDGALYASVAIGWIALIWYTFILAVCGLGYFQMYDSVFFFKITYN